MNFIDTHTHLYLPDFDEDRDNVINRAVENSVTQIILPNIDSSSIKPMNTLVEKYPRICYPLIGLHPTSVGTDFQIELKQIVKEFQNNGYKGIGEIGIDLYWDKTYFKEQTEAFEFQLRLAREAKIPAIIHARNSFNEIFAVMDKMSADGLFGIFHAFTGDLEQANKIIDMGFKLGIGGIVTFRNSGLDEVLKDIDLNHIVLETDSPYLAPVPKRGKRNESAYIPLIAEKLADIYQVPIKQVADITTHNAIEIFNLSR